MNVTQTIFTVFFAIFWGTAWGALPRWKAFQWPLVFAVKQVRHRLVLSILVLNVCPLAFFGLALWGLSGPNYDVICWNLCTVVKLILHGVVPAFATFGFYRLWLGIVELNPRLFYVRNRSELPQRYRQIRGEPTIHSLRLPGVTGPLNLLFAFVYIGVASAAVYVFP